jgi:hypothetical protein
LDEIKESKYISVICDGCTDTAAIEEEIVYVRTCNTGDIKIHFYSMTVALQS